MKRLYIALVLILTSLSAYAQPTGNIIVEVEDVWYGPVGSVDLDGYLTYKIYLEFENNNDFLSALYGLLQADGNPDSEDVFMYGDCDFYNDETFGGYIPTVNSGVCGFIPEACVDTYWTIGKEYQDDPGVVQVAVTVPAALTTGDPSAELIDDGAIFTLAGSANGYVDADNKVLIAQVTTCSTEFYLDFCVQTFVNGNQNSIDFWCSDEPFLVQNPCALNPLDTSPEIATPLLCFGETGDIAFDPSGNGTVTLELFEYTDTDTTLVTTQTDDFLFDALGEGDYFVVMTDEVGCIDTTDFFGFIEPTELQLSLDQISDNLCFGDAIAEWCPTITGGVEDYQILLETPAGDLVNYQNGECFTNLACSGNGGNYAVTVTDDNGCVVTDAFEVTCPAEIVIEATTTPVQCNGADDGMIELSITGGTGVLTLEFTDPDVVLDPSESPIDVTISDLAPGVYTLTVTDENNCVETQIFDVQEPAALDVTYEATDIICFGECSGVITWEAVGGIAPYEFTLTDLDGIAVDENALCAGEYIATVTDLNDCPFIDTLEIIEPAEILYELLSSNVSCFDAGDGSICISNVTGGVGVVEWQISSPPSEATPLGVEACFEMLPADTYVVTFVDEVGCTVNETGIIITEPAPLEIDANATPISCYGLNDGSIDVTASGGTGLIVITAPVNENVPYTLTDLPPGNVNVVITDETGCEDSVTIEIVEPSPVNVEILATTDISCGGDCDGSASIDYSGGTGDLTLFLNGDAQDPFVLCANEYEAIVVDENNCQDTAYFEIVQPDPIEFLINIDQVTCTGMNDGSVIIFPVGGIGEITWELLPEGTDIQNMFEGEYTIVGQDETGCVADSTFLMTAEIETDMEVEVFTSPVTCWNEADGTATAAVTGGQFPISYQWNDELEQTTATAIGLAEEVYVVTVTDAIGCTLSYLAEVEPTVGCFFIADALTPNDDGANDEWIIGGLEYFPNALVQVYNRWGQLLFESRGYSTRWDGTWNGSKLPVADYYYVITYDEAQEPITGTVTIKY